MRSYKTKCALLVIGFANAIREVMAWSLFTSISVVTFWLTSLSLSHNQGQEPLYSFFFLLHLRYQSNVTIDLAEA